MRNNSRQRTSPAFPWQCRALLGHGDDKVVAANNVRHQKHDAGSHDRPHTGKNDLQIGAPEGNALHADRLPEVFVHTAQAGENDDHDQPGRMPDAGNHQRVDRPVGIGEPVEGEILPTHAAHKPLQAVHRVEHPTPGKTGDDQRYGERIEEYGSKQRLGPDAAVGENGKQRAEGERANDVEHAENHHVQARHQPAVVREELDILVEAHEIVIGHQRRPRQGHVAGPDDRSVEKHRHDAEEEDDRHVRPERLPMQPGSHETAFRIIGASCRATRECKGWQPASDAASRLRDSYSLCRMLLKLSTAACVVMDLSVQNCPARSVTWPLRSPASAS